MQLKKQTGATLMELLVVLTIISVLLMLAHPYYLQMRYAMEARRAEHLFVDILKQAKAQTYISKKDVVICTINAQGQCDRSANERLIMFYDRNDNNQKDDGDELLFSQNWQLRYGTILLRTSASRGYIRYMGNTSKPRGHFGHLRYCSISDNPELSFKVIFNQHGQVRTERESLVDVGC